MTVTNVEAVSALMLELARLDEARKRLQSGSCKVSLRITAGYGGPAAVQVEFPHEDALAFIQRRIATNNIDLARFGVEIAKPAERDKPVPTWAAKPAEVLKLPRAIEPAVDPAVDPDDAGAA